MTLAAMREKRRSIARRALLAMPPHERRPARRSDREIIRTTYDVHEVQDDRSRYQTELAGTETLSGHVLANGPPSCRKLTDEAARLCGDQTGEAHNYADENCGSDQAKFCAIANVHLYPPQTRRGNLSRCRWSLRDTAEIRRIGRGHGAVHE
jgi:hypothetical protein